MTNPRLSAATTWIETRLLARDAAPELAAQLLAAIDAVDPMRQRKESKMLTIAELADRLYNTPTNEGLICWLPLIEAFAADVRAMVVDEAVKRLENHAALIRKERNLRESYSMSTPMIYAAETVRGWR